MGVGVQASKGFVSFFVRNMLDKFSGMAVMIILARKLTPYDFGLVSITEVLLSLITVFGTAGISEFLLAYRKKDVRKIFKATFWFNIIITLLIIVIFLVFAPIWAKYQKDDRIIYISFISAGIFFFSQLQMIAKTWLSKHLMYQKQVKIQTPFIILVQVSKVAAVFLGFGVYSLVIPSLIFQPILTILLFRGAKFNPGFRMYRERWKEVFAYTKHLIGANVLARIADQGDKIIISTFLSIEILGVYNIAMQLADLFTSQFIAISSNVLSSVLPKFADDKERFYKNYISFIKALIFLVFPFVGMMIVAAEPIILTLYGTKWIDAVIPLQILLIFTATRSATSSFGIVMNTYHLTKKTLILNVIYTPVHICSAFIGVLFGILGIASSMVFIKTVFTFLPVRIISKELGIPFWRWYKDVAPIWLATVGIVVSMLLAIYFIDYNSTTQLAHITWACVLGLVYMLLYYITSRMFLVKDLKTISSFLGLTVPKAKKYFNIIFRL